ncbi:RNA ligase 1 isoform X2 [Stegostoma tigrinum]|uniref:RNA ligase 1 isoform X2 n=1 Tax=Stegostoma tigrinum TaxID=3053191 RepID=UPI00202AC6EF|nr:RNA ligase 1 isoform X2 [Stegostoma tigrinum]
MQRPGSVQQKVPTAFSTAVRDEPATKRHNQSYRVLATGELSLKALEADIHHAIATEKVDGSCCYVTKYKEFTWNLDDDFRTVAESWIPAHEVLQVNDRLQPDENGHIPGWVPVEKGSKSYCWHLSTVNYDAGLALVLRPCLEKNLLEITAVPLADLLEQTLELVGTHINGNPYGLGNKRQPVHFLISHGSLQIEKPLMLNLSDLITWFEGSPEGKVEGIVWHCANGVLFKLHRHHLGLQWPVQDPYLTARPLSINVDLARYECDPEPKSSFLVFARLNGKQFDHFKDILWENDAAN